MTVPFIQPDGPPQPVPLYGDALDDLFHDTLLGILAGSVTDNNIRPRWQPEPPNQPAASEDWVAFGIVSNKGDWQAYQRLDPTIDPGNGATVFERDEELVVLHSFYGPNSMAVQSQYQDGLLIDQNRALLEANGIKLISVSEPHNVPALLKERFVKKVDQRVTFRRRVRRTYAIHYLVGATVDLDNEHYHTTVTVTP